MKCLNCGRKLNVFDEKCSYCGEAVFDDDRGKREQPIMRKKAPKQYDPIFTEEEAFFMHIHPDDETYRDIMRLNILSKKYE